MDENNVNENELTKVISDAVDESVDRAFRKYGGVRKKKVPVKLVLWLVIIAVVVGGIFYIRYQIRQKNQNVAPVAEHDLTLENHGIFGFKVTDFSKVILGEAKQKKELIVEERESSVNVKNTDAGIAGLGIFSKSQLLTVHGKGVFTVDLSKMKKSDITLDKETYTLTVKIPHAKLHTVSWEPEKTEIGDTEHGWLAFGSIKTTAEEQKKIDTEARNRLFDALNTDDSRAIADRFAKMTVEETLQPVIEKVSPAYKLTVDFQED